MIVISQIVTQIYDFFLSLVPSTLLVIRQWSGNLLTVPY